MSRLSPFFRYDLFKLAVALLLGVIVVWLLLATIVIWLVLGAPGLADSKAALPATATGRLSVQAAAPAQDNPTPSPTRTPAAFPTAAVPQAADPTAAPEATTAPEQSTAKEVSCPLAMASRLKVGARVRVLSTLYLRSEPKISGNLLLMNPPGTELEITGGPVCTPFRNSAHLWWEVQSADGITGWSAEGAANGSVYFMELLEP